MSCTKCNADLRTGAAFCPECGKKVKTKKKDSWYFTAGEDNYGDDIGANLLLVFDLFTLVPLMVWLGNVLFLNIKVVSAFAATIFIILMIINVTIHVLVGLCNGERYGQLERGDSGMRHAWVLGIAFLIIVGFGLLASWIFESIMGTFPDMFNVWVNGLILSIILTVILLVLSKTVFWRY